MGAINYFTSDYITLGEGKSMYKLATLKDLKEYNDLNNMDETLYNVNILKYSSNGDYTGCNTLWKTNNYKEALNQYHAFKYSYASDRCKIELTRATVRRDLATSDVIEVYAKPRYTFTTPKLKYALNNR